MEAKQETKHREWLKEGGVEHPTHLETLQNLEQQARINWLKQHCLGVKEILDIGCNWGYILNEINGLTGVDINPENLDLAIHKFPHLYFLQGDITKGLPFMNDHYAIVVMAELLEHLEWGDVGKSIREGLRIARHKLLITLPWRRTEDCALCFKHKWIPNEERIGLILTKLMLLAKRVNIECDGNFVYIEVLK